MILSQSLLLPFVVLVVVLAVWKPPYVLLLLDIALVMFPGTWQASSVWIDPTDIVFAGIVLGFVVHGKAWREARRRQIPHLRLWVLLGMLLSMAYINTPINSQYLTDPLRDIYQLYRYCWRPILYYPLVIMLLGEGWKLRIALVTLVFSADVMSLQAISQGYTGMRAMGSFDGGNTLGGALIVPSVLCLSGLISSSQAFRRAFFLTSAMLIGRSLMFSGSRGAFVGTLSGASVFFYALIHKRHFRSKIMRFAALGLTIGLIALAATSNLLDRPNVKRLLSASNGAEDETLRWRMQERWPHFWHLVLESPWFGVGTDVDPSLVEDGTGGGTPHNGYLAVALISGIPVLALYVTFAFLGVANALLLVKRASQRAPTIFGATIAAAVIGILMHNIVEATLHLQYVTKMFWMLVAMASLASKQPAILLLQPAVSRIAAGEGRMRSPGAVPLEARS